jgi:hypothetical protein
MSKLIVAAHQPNFMPNLGFFYKMLKADVFVLITNIQFERKEGWQRKNRIIGGNGDVWLTVPVFGSQNQRIRDVRIDNSKNWIKKHKKTLQLIYGKSEQKELLDSLLKLYDTKWNRLADINIEIIKLLKDFLGIETKVFVDENIFGEKQELLVNICKKYGASKYLSGSGAKSYMTERYFIELKENGLGHEFIEGGPSGKEYPYCAMHYVLSLGKERVNQIIRGDKCVKEVLQVIR